jgi:hypothetical protein
MKRARLLAGLVASAALLISASAHAVTFDGLNIAVGAAGADTGVGMNFNSIPASTSLDAPTSFSVGNWTFTNSAEPVQVNVLTSANGAQPFGTTGNYLSVLGSGQESVAFAPTSSFSFFWGSIDNFNTLVVDTTNNGDVTLTGTEIATLFSADGVQATGCQVQTNCNRYFTFSVGSGDITGFTMSSSTNSFEITNISAVPEASTWAMMVLGFLGLGFLGYRKSSNASFRLA